MKTPGWREILAMGGLVFAGVVLYRLSKLQAPSVAAVGQTVGDVAAEVIKLPYTAATAIGLGQVGSAIGSAAAPSSSGAGTTTNERIAWNSAMRKWLVGQGATDAEALILVTEWQPGMDAPTMDNVQRLRNGESAYSWWQQLKAN
jgi:hypothetical protein